MKQTTFASLAYAGKKKRTRREKFLAEMEALVPWARLTALIELDYPKGHRTGLLIHRDQPTPCPLKEVPLTLPAVTSCPASG